MIASPLHYGLCAGVIFAIIAAVEAAGTRLSLGLALLLVPAVGVPAWISLAYLAAVKRAHGVTTLRRHVWWAWAVDNPILPMTLALIPASLAVWTVLVAVLTGGWSGLAWIAASAAVLYPVAWYRSNRTDAYKPYTRLRATLRWTPVSAVLLTLIWMIAQGLGPVCGGSWAECVAAEPRFEGGRALFGWIVDSMAILNGTRGFAEAWAEGWGAGTVVTLWRAAAVFVQFLLLTSIFAGCLIPRDEVRRILTPSDADVAPQPTTRRVVLGGLIVGLLTWATVGFTVEANAWAEATQAAPEIFIAPSLPLPAPEGGDLVVPASSAGPLPGRSLGPLTPAAARQVVEKEAIGGLFCAPGTLADVEALDAEINAIIASQEAAVRDAVHDSFNVMRNNVDVYLDWHYSLTSQYLRTYLALIEGGRELLEGQADQELDGRFAQELEAQFADHLGKGDPFAPLMATLRVVEGNPAILDAYQAQRERLLAVCGLALPLDAGPHLVTASRPSDLLVAMPAQSMLAFQERLRVSGVAAPAGALVGALLGKAVLTKIAATAGFKAVSAAAAKYLVAKSAGWFGGAALGAGAGAVVCSWVPIIGTATCGFIGGVAGGIGAGLAVDKLLLEVEEALQRDQYRAEIIASIDSAEEEVLAQLFPLQ